MSAKKEWPFSGGTPRAKRPVKKTLSRQPIGLAKLRWSKEGRLQQQWRRFYIYKEGGTTWRGSETYWEDVPTEGKS